MLMRKYARLITELILGEKKVKNVSYCTLRQLDKAYNKGLPQYSHFKLDTSTWKDIQYYYQHMQKTEKVKQM